jgi:hypothetical protein
MKTRFFGSDGRIYLRQKQGGLLAGSISANAINGPETTSKVELQKEEAVNPADKPERYVIPEKYQGARGRRKFHTGVVVTAGGLAAVAATNTFGLTGALGGVLLIGGLVIGSGGFLYANRARYLSKGLPASFPGWGQFTGERNNRGRQRDN